MGDGQLGERHDQHWRPACLGQGLVFSSERSLAANQKQAAGSMKHAIAIAITRVRKRIHFATGKNESSNFDLFSEAWLSVLLFAGTLFGIGAVICLISALIRSGGFHAFLHGWFTALGG
jgi:VIT1/CCC1 family predicted Fe2+/Mn2+ transporter